MPISVIIPTYRNPTYLDLCLHSLFTGQRHTNQVIVVVDGYFEESETVLAKYPDVDVVVFPENKGQMVAHNTGVLLAENEQILIINDDNVAPQDWDDAFDNTFDEEYAISVNQIEPRPSIFKSFIIKDFGTTPETFRYDEFIKEETRIRATKSWDDNNIMTDDGNTWPLYMSKKCFMAVGGFDISFPSPAVADHDLFLRLEMIGLRIRRFHGCNFYHFAGAATKKTEEQARLHALKEQQSHEYFMWKWGFASGFDGNNSHLPKKQTIRGIQF